MVPLSQRRNTREEWDRERSYLDRHSLFEGAVDEPGEVILKELKIQDRARDLHFEFIPLEMTTKTVRVKGSARWRVKKEKCKSKRLRTTSEEAYKRPTGV